MNPSKIKAVLFDFGGTLDSDGIPWKDRFYPIYKKFGYKWKFKDFEKFFYAADDFLVEQKLTQMKYREMLLRQVGLVLERAGQPDERRQKKIALEFERDSFKTLRRNKPLLKKLRQRYKLGIVSNFYGNLPVLFREIGYAPLFGAVIDSVRAGVLKPHPGIFWAALDKLKVKPGEAVFVGDNPQRDIIGAKKMGMKRVWINTFSPNRKPPHPDDIVIQSLLELDGVLLT